MVARLSFRSRAEADLDDIWQFIAADNIAAADRVLDRIGEVFQLLADNPQAGRKRPELGAAVRSFAAGNYVVFYESAARGVDILRVLHGARDIAADDIE